MFTQTFTITEEEANIRIDKLCAQKFPQISRSRWQKAGKFKCNNIAKTIKSKTEGEQVWEVSVEEDDFAPQHLTPWDHPLNIIQETDDWAVIEKPEGISVHPSLSEKHQKTIVNALLHHFGKNLSENFDTVEGIDLPRPGIVHRLDKTTSGLLLVAKNNKTHKFLQKNWPSVEKIYTAIVHTGLPKKGRIEGAITRDPNNRTKMSVSKNPKAKDAITLFEVVESSKRHDQLDVTLLTGRTHQIRVHLSSIDHPIMGDLKYGGDDAERVFLHARKLTFPDPKTGKNITVESEIPKSFNQFFE